MSKIYCLMGKSSTGKDTIYKNLLKQDKIKLNKVISYTTRPIREGEQNGREYFYCSDEEFDRLEAENKLIEARAYNTVHGLWHYFTVDDGQIDLNRGDYLIIGTLETYLSIRKYFGEEKVVPIYVEVEDGERLSRALTRERKESQPKYKEMCRRFLADSEDFSEEKLESAGISRRFENIDLNKTIEEILDYMVK